MKNILVLTSIYPGDDINKNFTPVVHFFTREWVKMDCRVVVVHNLSYYPRFFYLISSLFSKLLATITGTNIPDKRLTKIRRYTLDDVEVVRIPIFKFLPRFKFSKKTILNQTQIILNELGYLNFKPDFIVGHWENPQLELIGLLKSHFCESVTSVIFHNKIDFLVKLYNEDTTKIINNIDILGFRSNPIKESFMNHGVDLRKSFMCYSGIPEKFVNDTNLNKEFKNKLKSFLYVGVLMKRKYPKSIIEALISSYKDKGFQLTYIGEGYEYKKIERSIKQFSLVNQIKLKGKVSRDEVWRHMLKSDCFVMISKDEAYGLVYLEAMSAGCITIASKNEGFDGIIKHGYNGFLCEAGNSKDLAKLIEEINKMDSSELREISKNAILTASRLTNYKAAERYLENLNLINNENFHHNRLLQ